MSVLGVVVPTVPGRELELVRALDSFRRPGAFAELGLSVVTRPEPGHDTCADAWNEGAAWLAHYAGAALEWLCFAADDLIADERWVHAALARARTRWRELPAPQLFLEDGRRDPRTDDGPDGVAVPFSRVPFLPAAAWSQVGPLPPLHYYSDVELGARLRELGYTFRVTAGYAFVHLWAEPGRKSSDEGDRRLLEDLRRL